MTIGFDRALGIHPLALQLRDQRTELLSANLANADTPNYKARDLDFQSVLKNVASTASSVRLTTTQAGHLQPNANTATGAVMYRVPFQASLDGNTVETEQEHVRFAANALQYQATLNFINQDIAGIKSAIRGD